MCNAIRLTLLQIILLVAVADDSIQGRARHVRKESSRRHLASSTLWQESSERQGSDDSGASKSKLTNPDADPGAEFGQPPEIQWNSQRNKPAPPANPKQPWIIPVCVVGVASLVAVLSIALQERNKAPEPQLRSSSPGVSHIASDDNMEAWRSDVYMKDPSIRNEPKFAERVTFTITLGGIDFLTMKADHEEMRGSDTMSVTVTQTDSMDSLASDSESLLELLNDTVKEAVVTVLDTESELVDCTIKSGTGVATIRLTPPFNTSAQEYLANVKKKSNEVQSVVTRQVAAMPGMEETGGYGIWAELSPMSVERKRLTAKKS